MTYSRVMCVAISLAFEISMMERNLLNFCTPKGLATELNTQGGLKNKQWLRFFWLLWAAEALTSFRCYNRFMFIVLDWLHAKSIQAIGKKN